ncbi:MAG: DUF4416 family protein [Brevinematales bacterium]|nr:DUF4416 family protein [Brevinematales bacterium]
MGIAKEHDKVKLVIPILFSDNEVFNKVKEILLEKFGEIDFESSPFSFEFTDYYNQEMGTPIYRCFISFKNLITPEELVNIKIFTNELEEKFATDKKRKINLDPGYLCLGKFILATTKDQQHRIYMGKGIFEEITLFYRNKEWQHYEWTYPDYRSEKYKTILTQIREIYKKNLKNS